MLAGLPTPMTVCVTPAAAEAAATRLGYPVVVKPLDGAGCEGVGLATNVGVLRAALSRPALHDATSVLVQSYVPGRAASVSLLVAEKRSIALSLNGQQIRAGVQFANDGGVASLPHPRSAEARELAQEAVALVPGLRGYVGVDLILGEETCWLIEDQSAADDVVCRTAPRDRPRHGRRSLGRVSRRRPAGRGRHPGAGGIWREVE